MPQQVLTHTLACEAVQLLCVSWCRRLELVRELSRGGGAALMTKAVDLQQLLAQLAPLLHSFGGRLGRSGGGGGGGGVGGGGGGGCGGGGGGGGGGGVPRRCPPQPASRTLVRTIASRLPMVLMVDGWFSWLVELGGWVWSGAG